MFAVSSLLFSSLSIIIHQNIHKTNHKIEMSQRPPRNSSRNSIQVFLKPDYDTVANLDFGLSQLRGSGTTKEQQQVPDHAFQVATLLLSHSRLDYVREGIEIMERLTFRAFEEYRHLTLISSSSVANNSSGTINRNSSTTTTGVAVQTNTVITGTVVAGDNRLTEEAEQRQKLSSSSSSTQNNSNNNNSSSIEKEKQHARDMLVSGYFLLGVGQFKLNEMTNARNCVERVLELEPHHPQAMALRDHIDELLMRNAAIGAGVLAAGMIGIAALAKGIFGK